MIFDMGNIFSSHFSSQNLSTSNKLLRRNCTKEIRCISNFQFGQSIKRAWNYILKLLLFTYFVGKSNPTKIRMNITAGAQMWYISIKSQKIKLHFQKSKLDVENDSSNAFYHYTMHPHSNVEYVSQYQSINSKNNELIYIVNFDNLNAHKWDSYFDVVIWYGFEYKREATNGEERWWCDTAECVALRNNTLEMGFQLQQSENIWIWMVLACTMIS